ncbi:MAG: AIM24 family protein [Bacteroidales bacterium]|nr:AIM24 family protein [Bacteroidales bacterium]MDT8373982.1 AIM24 family protein [Bacteroidales bacterium]
MASHEIDYKVYGDDIHFVEVTLDPGETVIAEAGAMVYMEQGIAYETRMGDGKAFVHAGGTVIERELNNETLRIDTGCIVAYEPTLDFDIETTGSLKTMVFGGEGLFLATMRGTGKVWLQSMPIRKLIRALAPMGANRGKEASGLLGNLFQ